MSDHGEAKARGMVQYVSTYIRVPRQLVESALAVIPKGCDCGPGQRHTWHCDARGEVRAALTLILSERGQAMVGGGGSLTGEPVDAVPSHSMPVPYSLCLELIQGYPSAIVDLRNLYRDRIAELERAVHPSPGTEDDSLFV